MMSYTAWYKTLYRMKIDKHILSLILRRVFHCHNTHHHHKLWKTTCFRLQKKYGNIFRNHVFVLCAVTLGEAKINISNKIYEKIFSNI
jgi:hypothetical protein